MYGRNARKRTDLWGNYTQWGTLARLCDHEPHVGHVPEYVKGQITPKVGKFGQSALLYESSEERAKIPYALSQAVRDIAVAKAHRESALRSYFTP